MTELIDALKFVTDVGGTIIVTAMLYVVWQRLNEVTDNVLALLAQMAKRELEEGSSADNEGLTEPLRPTGKISRIL